MYKWVITSAILFATLLGVFYVPSSASAASVYDDYYRTIDTLEISASGNFCPDSFDITLDWSQYILDAPDIAQGVKDSWLYAINNNGRWGVSQNFQGYNNSISVYWTEDDSLYLDWDSNPNAVTAKGNSMQGVNITMANYFGPCAPYAASMGGLSNIAVSSSPSAGYDVRNFLIYTDYPNYPTGYEGEEIVQEYEPPISKPEFSIYYNFQDKQLAVKDTTTYEGEPDECWIQLPNNLQGDNFNEYYYDCLNPEIIAHEMPGYQTFTIIVFVRYDDTIFSESFSLNINGDSCNSETGCQSETLESLINACMNEEFPFIHPEDCMDFLGHVLGLLSFDTIKVGNQWQPNTGCRTLVVLDDWLNYPGVQACPLFPSYIRDIVTPFITFLLGLITMRFVLNKTGGGFSG